MLSWLLLTILFLSHSVNAHYGCGSDRIKHKKIGKNWNIKPTETTEARHSAKKRPNLDGRAQNPDNSGTFNKIRIHYDASQLLKDWANYDKRDYFVYDVIPAALEWVENVVSVRPVSGRLTFDVRCDQNDGTIWDNGPNKGKCVSPNRDWQQCGDTGAIIPKYMFDAQLICPTGTGKCETKTYPQGSGRANTDLVIYFTGDASQEETSACENVMGFAAYCHTNARDRPIAGYVNLCRSTIDATDVFTWEEAISLIIHETFHVLGFSSDGFSNFKNADGSDRTDTYRVINKRGHNRAVITLPTVAKKAKEFFNCDSMEGIELENYGSEYDGELTSHWDNRIMAYDFMISYVPPAAPFSTFTLAVLADSGWYNIDWKYAQEPPYGRNSGCSWSNEECVTNGKSIDNKVFCTKNTQYSCSSSHIGKYYCSLATWNTILPENMQYFTSPTIGGDNVYPDFCPLFEEYSNGDCRLWGNNNIGTSDDNTAALGGLISGNSKCALIEGSTNGVGAGCYPTECFTNYLGEYVGVRMTIYRNFKLSAFDVMTCWNDESDVPKPFPFDYNAAENFGFDTIYCPDISDICYDENPWMCNGHGTRVNGECVCSPGYFGRDCTIENTEYNRIQYKATDSLSRFNQIVCHNGEWFYDDEHHNVGILHVEIDAIDDANYNELFYQNAIKNWVGILMDINDCDVDLRYYVYEFSTVATDVYYYSSSKTWTDVTTVESQVVFNKLFASGNNIYVSEMKMSDGVHIDNINSANIKIINKYLYLMPTIMCFIIQRWC